MMLFQMIIAGLFSIAFAAIINYVADVLPAARRLTSSKCHYCEAPVTIKRYLFPGKCSNCHRYFPLRHYCVLVGLFILNVIYALVKIQSLSSILIDLIIFSYLTLIIVIDIEHRLILHSVSIAGAIIMAAIGLVMHGLLLTVLGGAIGLAVMMVLFLLGIWFSKMLTKSRGVEIEEGLGFGDVTLAGVCGLLLGWPGISIGLFGGILLGGIFAVTLLLVGYFRKKYSPYTVIAYGPFLSIATMILWMVR